MTGTINELIEKNESFELISKKAAKASEYCKGEKEFQPVSMYSLLLTIVRHYERMVGSKKFTEGLKKSVDAMMKPVLERLEPYAESIGIKSSEQDFYKRAVGLIKGISENSDFRELLERAYSKNK